MSDELGPWEGDREDPVDWARRAMAGGSVPTFVPVVHDGAVVLASGAVVVTGEPFASLIAHPRLEIRGLGAIVAADRLYDACGELGLEPGVLPSGGDL